MKKAGRSPSRGRPAPIPIGGRSSRPPAEREALNLVLDVLSSTEGFEHAVDALLFLFQVGMDIEIERRADVGEAQYDAHGLVVAAARTNFASEKIVHERQAARAMMTFCFINAASRYHDSPVKQRAVHKDKIVDGHAHYLESKPPPPGGWYAKKPTEIIGEPTSL